MEDDKSRGEEARHLPDKVPQKNFPHQMAAACDKQGSAGDGRYRPDKRGSQKEEMVLDWTFRTFLRKEVNNDCAVALGWKPEEKKNRGRPKTTWRRTVEKERDRQGWNTWAIARLGVNNRQQWREDVLACAPPGAKRFN